MMWTSSNVYGTCFTGGEDALLQFPSTKRTLHIFSFFILEFVFLLGV